MKVTGTKKSKTKCFEHWDGKKKGGGGEKSNVQTKATHEKPNGVLGHEVPLALSMQADLYIMDPLCSWGTERGVTQYTQEDLFSSFFRSLQVMLSFAESTACTSYFRLCMLHHFLSSFFFIAHRGLLVHWLTGSFLCFYVSHVLTKQSRVGSTSFSDVVSSFSFVWLLLGLFFWNWRCRN